MKEIILVKDGEIALKGLNKSSFEQMLISNIKRRLKDIGEFSITRAQSTIYVEPKSENTDLDAAVEKLKKVFGIATLCKALVVEKDYKDISEKGLAYLEEILPLYKTFKVVAKRSDKHFPMKSPEIAAEFGGDILEKYPHLNVNMKTPDITVTVEIRETNAYIHAQNFTGAGGMPVGSAGEALLLLSGGIDSPVAGYMMAKRGIHISAIHFISPPYTSDRARIKVEQLSTKMADYCGDIRFFCVPFTEIQEMIKEHCPEELFTVIMRRIMMKIALRIAADNNLQALITGESLGQVASQTMMALACTDAVSTIPVFRPVIGMDKSEIVDIARKIDTFDTSILPYEDCCTVFTPKHPKTRPIIACCEEAEEQFGGFPALIDTAVQFTTVTTFRAE
ncbi:MAG: tRNA uracil 4-sulfurtransferase ThiI [Oscillospiraceae bacterium]